MFDYGTKHVGVRRIAGTREWETFDRETGNRIGMPHPTRWEAAEYAEHRQETTYEPQHSPFVRRAFVR